MVQKMVTCSTVRQQHAAEAMLRLRWWSRTLDSPQLRPSAGHRFPPFVAKIHSRLRSRHRGAKMASEGERTVMSRVIQKPGMWKDADA